MGTARVETYVQWLTHHCLHAQFCLLGGTAHQQHHHIVFHRAGTAGLRGAFSCMFRTVATSFELDVHAATRCVVFAVQHGPACCVNGQRWWGRLSVDSRDLDSGTMFGPAVVHTQIQQRLCCLLLSLLVLSLTNCIVVVTRCRALGNICVHILLRHLLSIRCCSFLPGNVLDRLSPLSVLTVEFQIHRQVQSTSIIASVFLIKALLLSTRPTDAI